MADGGELRMARIVAIGGATAVIALVLLVVSMATIELPPPGADVGGYIRLYRPPKSGFEAQLDLGDGQAYAAFAQDPTLAHTREYFITTGYIPPLASRPTFIYAIWATSLGQPGLLPYTFTALQSACAGVLAAGCAALIQLRGRPGDDRWAILVVFLPGALTSLRWFGPELLAVGLGLFGLTLWLRDPPRTAQTASSWAAVALFTAAGLTRELMLLVPAAVAAHWLVIERRPLRRVAPLAVAPAAYLAWSAWVIARLGSGADQSTGLLRAPVDGLLAAASRWTTVDAAVALAALALVIAAVVRRPRDVLSWCLVAVALLAPIVNAEAVRSWEGFSRVFLPVYVLGLLQLLPAGGGAAPEALERDVPAAAPGSGGTNLDGSAWLAVLPHRPLP